jgi:antitoxin SocA-like protein
MPLFPRTDPDLRSLIGYLHARAEDRGIALHRTKLIKLLYLVDVECARGRRAPLTGLEWVFSHHGPHAEEVVETVKAMLDSDLAMPTWKEARLRRGGPEAPDCESWPASTKGMVDRVMDRFAARSLDELLDHVYFHTGPMRGARRGAALDMDRAREDQPLRRAVPLAAPERPGDAAQRLGRWRRLPAVTLDPPGAFLSDRDDNDDVRTALRGRLQVPGA